MDNWSALRRPGVEDGRQRQLSLSADVYRYAVYYALCQETDEYGKLQELSLRYRSQTSLLRNAISNYSDTDRPDDPKTSLRPLQRNRPQDRRV